MQNHCRALSEPIIRERGQDADLVRDPTYLLIAIIEKEFQLDASLYTCLQILSVSIFEKHRFHAPCSKISQTPTCTATLTI
jgi:hypothetical protein